MSGGIRLSRQEISLLKITLAIVKGWCYTVFSGRVIPPELQVKEHVMYICNKSQVTLNEDHAGLTGEASEMGLAPGEWPEFIAVIDNAGEGFLFGAKCMMRHCGEFAGYRYTNNRGVTLTVFND